MKTAAALLEIYNAMPQNVKSEFIDLLKNQTDSPSSKLLAKIEKGLKGVKKVKEGKARSYSLNEILNEN